MDFCKLTFKEKRNIVEKIPENTFYCYTVRDDNWYICPYWESISHNKEGFTRKAKCNLLNIEDKYSQDIDTLLWDQVKICGYRDYDGRD